MYIGRYVCAPSKQVSLEEILSGLPPLVEFTATVYGEPYCVGFQPSQVQCSPTTPKPVSQESESDQCTYCTERLVAVAHGQLMAGLGAGGCGASFKPIGYTWRAE
jgi:hypothetical protein